ncbi:sensor histidine kinase [Quatrionicoccus australiensis]|uniref:sensor histidine kinase n=1 Tax=Quatrionicoccus australiensis TaxID=138118 RepID=UPI001CF897E7|nr:ATP-binding protein [Quatrionicoccus australiensis]UCV13442.1 hypothetical protein KI612_10690 [Quatrionicoccus australiensis]
MPHGVNIFSANPELRDRAVRRVLALFLLPLGIFVGIAVWQYRLTPDVQRVGHLAIWLEPLGDADFTPEYLQQLAVKAPDFSGATWSEAQSPLVMPAQPAAGKAKTRLWLRISVPEQLAEQSLHEGRLGILVNRIIGSGPWSAWSDGGLLQTDRKDWGMQWNTPMRVMLPVGAQEIYLSLPVIASEGYALGSIFMGMADDINLAWQARDLWMTDLPRAASIVALMLALMTLPMALRHRRERVYALFSANALVWCLTNLQYFHDFTGNPGLSTWFGLAMDLSINWNVILSLLFAFEFQSRPAPRITGGLLAYAALSSIAAVSMLLLGQYSLFANHYGNIIAFSIGLSVYLHRWIKEPSREGFVLLLAMLGPLGAGVHSLLYVSSMAYPDHVHTFPFAVLASFFAFLYAISHRSALAIEASEKYQSELQRQLSAQKALLNAQHRQIAELEIQQRLTTQREAMLQDLHDGLGSNLTSALFQARKGNLSQADTVLLLQELAEELRQLSVAAPAMLGVNDILAELRQRIQKRLTQGGISLEWEVATDLPRLDRLPADAGQHLRAMLSEAIANVLKHAGASRICVFAECVQNDLRIEIADNGCSFDPDNSKAGRGLAGARHRAELIGCGFGIERGEGGGSRFWISMPVADDAQQTLVHPSMSYD